MEWNDVKPVYPWRKVLRDELTSSYSRIFLDCGHKKIYGLHDRSPTNKARCEKCPSLNGGPRQRSLEANDSRAKVNPADEARVATMAIQVGSEGFTDDELEVRLELLHQTASARRRALVQKGLLVDSGETRPTRSGRQATVWVLRSIKEGRLFT